MRPIFDAADHYWIVGKDTDRVYSSLRRDFVARDDAAFAAWAARPDRQATRIATSGELWQLLAKLAPASLPDDPQARKAVRERGIDAADKLLLELVFAQENRLRALEGKSGITPEAFRAAIRNGTDAL